MTAPGNSPSPAGHDSSTCAIFPAPRTAVNPQPVPTPPAAADTAAAGTLPPYLNSASTSSQAPQADLFAAAARHSTPAKGWQQSGTQGATSVHATPAGYQQLTQAFFYPVAAPAAGNSTPGTAAAYPAGYSTPYQQPPSFYIPATAHGALSEQPSIDQPPCAAGCRLQLACFFLGFLFPVLW